MMETMRHGAALSTNSPEYLVQLLKDKRQLQTVPGCFVHLERILDEGEPSSKSVCVLSVRRTYIILYWVDFHMVVVKCEIIH